MSFVHDGWYCAAFSSELEGEPLGRTLIDQPVVLLRSRDGQVSALSDICPHRFAPLHRGRFENDAIYCPYHGLGFDRDGRCIHNPHGDGAIPRASAVNSFAVREEQGVIWIWGGDPLHANPALIPDLQLFDNAISGSFQMNADYRLVIDNLLDLNHAPYLHAGTLSPVGSTRETTWERGARSAASHYVMRSVETPASQKLWFDDPVGDYHVSMEWHAPTILRQRVSMTNVGAPPDDGAMLRAAHLLTPETATTMRYFWMVSRNRLQGDETVDAALRNIVEHAFLNEDAPMIEACQKNMRGRSFRDLRPVFLKTDGACGHARSVLERLTAA